MPGKKPQVNGYWLFAQANKAMWKAQGMIVNTNDQLLGVASPLWKALPAAERKEWDVRAKEQRRQKSEGADGERFDNVGNLIWRRKDPFEEARNRRQSDLNSVTSKWPGKDLTEEKFYLIHFQDMFELTEGDNTEMREWFPREMALIEYCLSKGITKTLHQFIWPGKIPLGYRLRAEDKSKEYHMIPVEKMEEDSDNYHVIWRKVLEVVSEGVKDGRYPPLYCMAKEYEKVKYLCDWLWRKSGDIRTPGNPLGKVHSLEDVTGQLLAFSGKPDTGNISVAPIASALDGNQWDYIPFTACEFHKDLDVSRHCSLAVVRKLAYTLSDMVGIHYNITFTERHLPAREEPSGISVVYHPVQPQSPLGQGQGRKTPAVNNEDRPAEGRPYAELAQSPEHRGAQRKEEEEEEEQYDSDVYEGPAWHKPRVLSPNRRTVGDSHRVPDTSPDLTSDGSINWSILGAPVPVKQQETRKPVEDEEDFPALQVSNMKLTDMPPAWGRSRGTRGQGAGVRSAGAQPGLSAPSVKPPPGFTAVHQSNGQGFSPGVPNRATIPVGRGSRPPGFDASSQELAAGRTIAVSRGMVPSGVGQGVSMGRSGRQAFGRGFRPPPDRETGAPFNAGRGYMGGYGVAHVPSVGGDSLPLGSLFMTGDTAEFEKGAGAREQGVPSIGLSQPVSSFSPFMVSSAGLDADTDNFEPPSSCPDFPSLLSNQGHFGDTRGVSSGRASGGNGVSGAVQGRGFMPSQGRGFMPKNQWKDD